MLKLKDFIEAFGFINEEDSWINIKTGEVYNRYDFDYQGMDDEEIEEFLWNDDIVSLPSQYELNEYRDMVSFTDSLDDEKIKNNLYKALNGRGAYRRFKDEIIYQGVRDAWFKYRDECLKEKVIAWLEDNEIEYEE